MKKIMIHMVLLLVLSTGLCYAEEMADVAIRAVKAAGNVHMLMGRGGNIGVCTGVDGVFLVDDQFAPLTDKIRAAVANISDRKIRFLINTHWHRDHVGGNENLGKAGTVIFAHENVRKRMSEGQFMKFFDSKVPAAPAAALPVVTFTQDIKFHLNGEEIRVFHLAGAHTDGDAVVFFANANVIHTGDIYFAGAYPFIDLESNGSVSGLIEAINRILLLIDTRTRVIPGHGPMSNKGELEAYVRMLASLRDRIGHLISEGKTLEEVLAAAPSKAFDEKWGKGFISPEKFIRILYTDLSG